MSSTLSLSLTDEMTAFIHQHSGEGTLFPTAGEFVRNVLREKMERLEAARIREAILEGYQDAHQGRVVKFEGNLRELLKGKSE